MGKLLILLLFIILLGGGVFFFHNNPLQATNVPLGGVQPTVSTTTQTRTQTENTTTTSGLPLTLNIPDIQVEAPIEYVGMDAKGNMDVPKDDMNVAWFQPGYKPGDKGNAVLAGHLDTKTGAPAIFYKLDTLSPGDSLFLTTKDGEELEFIVTHIKTYPVASFPLNEVFGPSEKSRLNLITCEGTFNSASRNYSHRTVVYSELKK